MNKAIVPPMVPERGGIVSIPDLYHRSSLWAERGRISKEDDLCAAASELEGWVAPLVQKRAFQALWCKEEDYVELDLPFKGASSSALSYPEMGLQMCCNGSVASITTLAGDHTTLGAIQASDVEIRAFGPQASPLNDSRGFGIYRLPDEGPLERWTACAAFPEIWLEVGSVHEENSYHLDLRFLGLQAEKPLYFAFYIKAKEAKIGSEHYLPKALRRYQGDSKPVRFDLDVLIRCNGETKMELIPLAGEGCFWNCEFLLAFEVPLTDEKLSFDISVI